jgi:hypothetical protein
MIVLDGIDHQRLRDCKSSEMTSNYFASILLSSFKSTVSTGYRTCIEKNGAGGI